jgi:prepilin-type processing-associated H-X9-DG protein
MGEWIYCGYMVVNQQRRSSSGFTLGEVVFVVVVIVLLGILYMPRGGSRTHAQRILCVNNLKQVALANVFFAADHGGKYPAQTSTNSGGSKEWAGTIEVYRHFQVISNELGNTRILCCPADDKRKYAAIFADFGPQNLSYWLDQNATTNGVGNLIAGDRNLLLNGNPLINGCYQVSTHQPLSWDKTIHENAGNVSLCDGSVQRVDSAMLQSLRLQQSIPTNWLAIP